MIRAIVTDIEGTTSSISFVKDVLFPYAAEHLPAFVASHGDKPDVKTWLDATARDAGLDPADRGAIVATLLAWIREDRKATPLKALQGMIWADGYESGAYRAHMYPEVAKQLRDWKASGLPLYVYSSGSVAAQKLFFRYSEAGDLTPLFDGYFDTEIGGKREAGSYARIAEAIGVEAKAILFLSDIAEELDAARAAGLQTTWLCRPPLECPPNPAHACVDRFDAIMV
ncbi:acireductone synthase [Tahibacter amnicola]|uniref:Enolase-phosphatase E1 n=1 Tax=Tahibacter amnicola TaxID=2976241 RepID=A0ABY6BDA9_9GAMM|nr:acireductone synthase [Tahibacter amnicola]UXI67100.1 acireductone synthase [Tahibacter amnicola]